MRNNLNLEDAIVESIVEKLKSEINDKNGNKLKGRVVEKENLYYYIPVSFKDNKYNLEIDLDHGPKRGNYAFQTDFCFYDENNVPRVVIEFKLNLSTHDVLTYSAKAKKHKNVYPFLRYGMCSIQLDKIPGRFFLHNEDIDFAFALDIKKDNKIDDEILTRIVSIIKNEYESSKELENIYNNIDCDYYSKTIKIDKI